MAAPTNIRPHRIELKVSDGAQFEEGPCTVDVLPGMLLERVSGTGEGESGFDRHSVRPHTNAGTRGELLIALEDALQGRTIDDTYESDPAGDGSEPGDPVQYIVGMPGDVLYLLAEGNNNFTDGTALESNGAGLFQPSAGGYPGDTGVVAVAIEDLDLTGEAAAHIRARLVS